MKVLIFCGILTASFAGSLQLTLDSEKLKVCYTQWFDRDDPSGQGDYETLADLRKEYPGKICDEPLSIEATTLSGVPAANTEQGIQTFDTVGGFACVNNQQKKESCLDYRVRFRCPCDPPVCYTQWFDRDDPSGKGDYETLVDLRKEYPGKICDAPLSIEATTLSGVPAANTGQVIQTFDTVGGFACVNNQQKKGSCLDYRVRFRCPCDPPANMTMWTPQDGPLIRFPVVCYTQWFDRDDPSGKGDYETLVDLRKEYPGKICDKPLSIEATTLSGVPAANTGQVIQTFDTVGGFACVNNQQKKGSCLDYRVRFRCPCDPPVCYTQWFDRDDPSGKGDYETLVDLRKEYPGKICAKPLSIEATTLSGVPAANTGQVIQTSDPVVGFACVNANQKNGGWCLDYKVRFQCLCPFP